MTPVATTEKARYPNRDPITDEPGAHMVGTGIGAAAGGMAGIAATAATGTMIGGPIGPAVGLVAGAVVGGLLGSAASEALLPTEIDQHWSSSYTREPYYNSDYSYDDYLQAYLTIPDGLDGDADATPPARFFTIVRECNRSDSPSRFLISASVGDRVAHPNVHGACATRKNECLRPP